MKNIKTGTYINYANNDVINFDFATDLSAYRKIMFVNYVVNSIVEDDGYNSIVKDLIFDFYLVRVLTNIDTSFINQKDDEDNSINPIVFIEQFLEETNVVDIVKANMVDGLLDELNKAVDKSIEYKTGIHPSPLNDALTSLVNTLEKKVKEYDMSGAMEMVQKFVSMTEDLNVDSVVNTYINNNMHKKNLKEIAESKNNEVKMSEGLGEAVRTVIEENKAEKSEVVS